MSGSGGSGAGSSAPPPVAIGAITGFGVNGQPRNWGTSGAAVKPALDMLVQDLGANFFRVEIAKGQSSWEQNNDDADPNHFEWTKYDPIFQGKDFRDLFDYVRYLNQLGVPEVVLAAHGPVASWMGGFAVATDKEDEFVETMLAVMVYARTRAPAPRPVFTLVSPWNETNVGQPEGVRMDYPQGVRLLHKLVTRMNALPELNGIAIVGPDPSDEGISAQWRGPMLADPVIRARLRGVSFHRYGGYMATSDWRNADPPQWLTEFNDWGGFCYTPSWGNAMGLAGNLLGALQNGVTAGLVWTDYDAPHSHDNDNWETFGLLRTAYPGASNMCSTFGTSAPSQAQLDQMTYAPRNTYQTAKHAFHYIARGAVRATVSTTGSGLQLVAFKNPNGQTVVFGTNTGSAGTFAIKIGGTTPPSSMVPWVSTSSSFHQKGTAVALTAGSGNFTIPASSVFTLVGGP